MRYILRTIWNLSWIDRPINVLNSFPYPIPGSNFKTPDGVLYDINMPHYHSCKTLPTQVHHAFSGSSIFRRYSHISHLSVDSISCFLHHLLLDTIFLSRYWKHATYLLSTFWSCSNCPKINKDQWLSNFIMSKNHWGHL